MSETVVYPPEGANYTDWVENADSASQVATQFAEQLVSWESGGFVAAILVGATIALRLARFIPTWGPLVSGVGHRLVDWISPDKAVQARHRADVMSDTAWQIVEAIEDLPADMPLVQELKARIKKAAPEEFLTIFEEWKRSNTKSE